MAKHEITIHENRSVTKEVAPYTGTYISKETFRIENFKAKLAERCGLPAIQVQAILTGAFEAIESLEGEGLVRIHLDGFTVCGIITGSFPTADAAFNKEKNSLQMAVRLDEPIRNDLADVTPTVITDASVTKLRVDNVMDLEAPRPYNVIHGKHVFRVAGFNMVLSDEGAETYLENSRGTKFPLVVDEVVTKQLFKAHTETLLEPGDYKLVVKSKAGDAEGPLQTDYRRVKYLEIVDPPTPLRISITDAKAIASGRIVRIKCENAEGVSGYHEDEYNFGFWADISVNGANKGAFSFGGPKDDTLDGYVEIEDIPFSAGDTVKVTVHPDPEKTEYVQEDASFTTTAE